jgi:hypothetical protein
MVLSNINCGVATLTVETTVTRQPRASCHRGAFFDLTPFEPSLRLTPRNASRRALCRQCAFNAADWFIAARRIALTPEPNSAMEGGNLGVLLPPRRRSPTLDSPFIMKVIDSITVAERASAAAAPEEIEAWDRSRCVQGTSTIPVPG